MSSAIESLRGRFSRKSGNEVDGVQKPNGEKRISLSNNGFGVSEILVGVDKSPNIEIMKNDWDNIAPEYVDGYRLKSDSRLELVEVPELMRRVGTLFPRAKVLDVGSGPLIFAERNVFNSQPIVDWPKEYWGVDPSKEMWSIAHKRTETKHWVRRVIEINNGIENADLPEEYFNIAIANFSLENSPDPKQGIRRVYDSLVNGGVFAGLLKHEDRNERYLGTYADMDFRKFLESLSVDSLWAKEYWEGCGEGGSVWALYTLNKVWERWLKEGGFSSVELITPEISEEIKNQYPLLTKKWDLIGNSGLIFVAKK